MFKVDLPQSSTNTQSQLQLCLSQPHMLEQAGRPSCHYLLLHPIRDSFPCQPDSIFYFSLFPPPPPPPNPTMYVINCLSTIRCCKRITTQCSLSLGKYRSYVGLEIIYNLMENKQTRPQNTIFSLLDERGFLRPEQQIRECHIVLGLTQRGGEGHTGTSP